MSYNPWVCAFQSLTCRAARQFYLSTAIEHSFLTVAVFSLAAHHSFQAGRSARRLSQVHFVPLVLLAVAAFSAHFSQSAQPVVPPLLSGFCPASLLPSLAPVASGSAPVVSVVRASVLSLPGSAPVLCLPPASLSSLSVTQLRQLAKARGIPGVSRLSKAVLVQALS